MRILVFNCGSSSLKFELLELGGRERERQTLARGIVEDIGTAGEFRFTSANHEEATGHHTFSSHSSAGLAVLDWLDSASPVAMKALDAVAHRVVHGADEVDRPMVVTPNVMAALERASEFAPLHNPPALATLRTVGERLAPVPVVVVADTSFHRTLPEHARQYAIPRELARRHGIRRFGFHGIGHAWMTERYAALSGRSVAEVNLVTLHLGAGCSATAVRAGRSVDTSMGFTPLEGLMMGSRSGDLDPAVVAYLCEREGKQAHEIVDLLNHQSGLLGVSGVSADLRDVQKAAKDGHPAARLAFEMFCYRVRKYVGAYLAALGKAQAIVFGGGIGEHSAEVREDVCAGLGGLGLALDRGRNLAANGREERISQPRSKIEAYVIPIDEELYIARAAAAILGATG